MFVTIDDSDPTPVYKQIVDSVREQVAQGIVEPGYSLPSVRELASYLNINVNTVNRAYQILKDMRLIVIRPARGAVIAPNADEQLGSVTGKKLLRDGAIKLLQEAKRLGFKKNDLIKVLKEID